MLPTKRMRIILILAVSPSIPWLNTAKAAIYNKQNNIEQAQIQVEKLALIDSLGNRLINTLRLQATDTIALHVGQKFLASGIQVTTNGIEDATFTMANQTLVIPELYVEQRPAYNVVMQLTATEPKIELIVTGLGIVGLQGPKGDTGANGVQGPKGDKGDTGAAGANGLTISINGVTQVGGNVTLTKAHLDLANVDNTSDANKPVSTATQTALALKAPLASPALTGTPTAPTQSLNDSSTKIATTEFVQNNLHQTHTLGEAFGGGIVFYLAPGSNGTHGLIVANQDQYSGSWYSTLSQAGNPAYFDIEGKKYTDWRLPWYFELIQLCVNQGLIPGITTTAGSYYWSAEADTITAGQALGINFTNPANCSTSGSNVLQKSTTQRVRAVRSF